MTEFWFLFKTAYLHVKTRSYCKSVSTLGTLYKCHKDPNAHVQFYIAQHFFVSQK